MEHRYFRNFSEPDEITEFPGVVDRVVEFGDLTVARQTLQPGWRWSTHVRPQVGGDSCQARHVGVVLSGRLGIQLADGTSLELGPDDVYEIPPGHDGWVVGDEPVVSIEWSGVRAFYAHRLLPQGRVLVTLLFTDLVGSTETLARVGDARWRELLSGHLEAARGELERARGREVTTTGDGMLATFDGPAQAIHCAAAIARHAEADGLAIRAGVHVGEVERLGDDVRGMAVHEAARITGEAGAGEILVSETTHALAMASGLRFAERGTFTLKGVPGERRLFAYVRDAGAEPAGPP